MYSHLHFINMANVITILGLCCGIFAGLLAIDGNFYLGILLYMLAGVLDLLDGPIARRSQRSKEIEEFGSHLDPLVDACIQGLIPVLFFYSSGLNNWYSVAVLMLFCTATVWRLSYFESFRMIKIGDGNYFFGFPTYTIMFTMPVLFLIHYANPATFNIASVSVIFLEAILMVSPIKVYKPSPKPVILVFLLITAIYLLFPLRLFG